MHPARACAYQVLAHAQTAPARLGGSRLVLIDGPAGSGKTTLAKELASLRPAACVVHLDDLYPGWDGLLEAPRLVRKLLLPMATGQPGCYRRFDWYLDRRTDTVVVPPRPLVIIEGCGSGASELAPLTNTLVWVEAPRVTRWERGQQRGGVGVSEHWRTWSVREDILHLRERTKARADVVCLNR